MPDLTSQKGKIMLAIQELIKGQVPEDLSDEEVEVREDWLGSTGDPYQGISIVDQGEQYNDGTIGTEDVGYIVGIIFAKHRTFDSVLSDDKLVGWYEQTRRRLLNQRLLVPWYGPTAPREHVVIIMPGRTLTDAKKWPNYTIRQMVVVSWIRELPVSY